MIIDTKNGENWRELYNFDTSNIHTIRDHRYGVLLKKEPEPKCECRGCFYKGNLNCVRCNDKEGNHFIWKKIGILED
jgi:hypothetical protein